MLNNTKEAALVAAAAAGAPPVREKLRLGDVLVRQGLVSAEQLQTALERQRSSGQRLGRVLVEAGLVAEDQVAHALARQLRAPAVNLKSFPLKSETVRLLSEAAARRHRAIVLEDRAEHLLVGFADPLDLAAYDDVARLLKRPVRLAVVPESQLGPAHDRHYSRADELSGLAKAVEREVGEAVDFGELQSVVGQEGAPLLRLLQSVFDDALRGGASDIHVEPQEHHLVIRTRVDGLLQVQTQADKRIAPALAQRLKLMAGLDIAEKRLPQDGRFSLRVAERTLDVRLSTLPTPLGESLVMRLLGAAGQPRQLAELGLPPSMLAQLQALLARQSGMLVVTGPTGSGKTTTLYAALAGIDLDRQKVITVEDPIEYRLPGVTQVQVNDKIELDFARVLRAALRQDPDVILVGEIRDAETADIGLRSAVTGHLVLSTLHTRSAAAAPFRLLDMGVPPYMLASALQAVVAQRLLRRNCERCAEPHEATPQEHAWLLAVGGEAATGVRSLRGRGCPACHGSGCSGRLGVYELLAFDARLAEAATRADNAAFRALAAQQLKGRQMAHHALELVRAGRVPLSEALHLTIDLE
jgi:MSHA biogenesis protein MshE